MPASPNGNHDTGEQRHAEDQSGDPDRFDDVSSPGLNGMGHCPEVMWFTIAVQRHVRSWLQTGSERRAANVTRLTLAV